MKFDFYFLKSKFTDFFYKKPGQNINNVSNFDDKVN